MRFNKLLLSLVTFVLFGFQSMAQIHGSVVDATDQSPIIGASVVVVGTTKGAITDASGNFTINASAGSQIEISFIGYENQRSTASEGMKIALKSSATNLQEVVVSTGSRASQRVLTDTPLPVDIVSPKELLSTGQPTFDKALQYAVPSFNTVMTPVNDATSLLDPYEIRNMGPSRTLILINGKRKNSSALTYIQTSPGRGESGADISAIPQNAIKRIEILRDGASAQYGSDAIAGVMNIILKDRYDYGSVNVNTGVSGKGDGFLYGFSVNNGSNFGSKGYINYTIDLSHQNKMNRSGILSAQDEASYWGVPLATTQAFLAKMPDGGNKNSSAEITSAKFLVNGGIPLSNNSEVYFNAAYVNKKANSLANYRTPYWRDLASNPGAILLTPGGNPADYMGYNPTFLGDLNDYNATLGFKNEKNGWHTDVSLTTGGNKQTYVVSNSINRKEGLSSPTTFHPGGFRFGHVVGNVDINKQIAPNFNWSVGSEFRNETFQIMAGDSASYGGVKGLGYSDSFNGFRAENATTSTRSNFGIYTGFDWDVTKNFLIAATARNEQYSDFGNAFVWKVSSRIKLMEDKLTLRGSVSTGFRAPSLAQVNQQVTQASFSGGTIVSSGIINNISPLAMQLGIPSLKPEKSINYTAGFGYSPNKNFSMTLDYYSIQVNNRIILSGDAFPTTAGNTKLDAILTQNGYAKLAYFVNGLNSLTQGIDFVANQRNLALGAGKLGITLSANFTLVNKKIANSETTPSVVKAAGQSALNPTVEALMFTSRPKQKVILGMNYRLGKVTYTFNNTLFGSTTFKNADLNGSAGNLLNDLSVKFDPKVVTDLGASVDFGKNTTVALTINNLFNVLPHWKLVANTSTGESVLKDAAKVHGIWQDLTFDGRYPITTYDGSQFSQFGTMILGRVQFRF